MNNQSLFNMFVLPGKFISQRPFLGGGFKYFLFSPRTGEDEPNLTSIFFRWVGSTTNQFCFAFEPQVFRHF